MPACFLWTLIAVASLRLVSPGAVTDDVTLFTCKTDDLFSHRPTSSPLAPSPLSTWWFIWCSSEFSRKTNYTFIQVSFPRLCRGAPPLASYWRLITFSLKNMIEFCTRIHLTGQLWLKRYLLSFKRRSWHQLLVTMHQPQFIRRVVLQCTINEFIQLMSLRSEDQRQPYAVPLSRPIRAINLSSKVASASCCVCSHQAAHTIQSRLSRSH